MAKATLPTNYQDDVLKSTMGGKRRYNITGNSDGSKCFDDVTQYDKVGSNFGAADMNKTNAAVNASADASKIMDNVDDITANTQAGYMMGALAGKQLIQNLGNINGLLPSGITNLADLLKYWISNGYLNDPNLKALVPYLTGNDSHIIHNSSNTNYPMWQVYDNNMVTAGIGATYIGFDFSASVCVRRIEWQGFNAAYTGFGKNSHVQGSVDGTSWVNVYEFDGGNSYGARVINAFANSQSYRYWRVQNGTGAIVGLAFLQFYGV